MKRAPAAMAGVAGMEGMGGGAGGVMGGILGGIGNGPAPVVRLPRPRRLPSRPASSPGNKLGGMTSAVSSHCQGRPHPGNGGSSGNNFQGRHNRKSSRRQRSADAAAGRHGSGEDLALQTLSAQWRAGRGGNAGQRGLHPRRLMPGSIRFSGSAGGHRRQPPCFVQFPSRYSLGGKIQ